MGIHNEEEEQVQGVLSVWERQRSRKFLPGETPPTRKFWRWNKSKQCQDPRYDMAGGWLME